MTTRLQVNFSILGVRRTPGSKLPRTTLFFQRRPLLPEGSEVLMSQKPSLDTDVFIQKLDEQLNSSRVLSPSEKVPAIQSHS